MYMSKDKKCLTVSGTVPWRVLLQDLWLVFFGMFQTGSEEVC